MSSSQQNRVPEEADIIDWEELYYNLDVDAIPELLLEAGKQSPNAAIWHAPIISSTFPDLSQFCDYGTPSGVPVWSHPVMWSDRGNNAQHYSNQGAGAVQGTSGTRLVNGLSDSALRRPPRPSSSYNEAESVTSMSTTTSAPVAVASSSGKRTSSRSSPKPKKGARAKAGSPRSRKLKTDSMALVPVQQPGDEDGNGADAKPVVRKLYLHQLDPSQEPDKKERARIRKAKLHKKSRDQAKAMTISPDCLAVCGGDLRTLQLVNSLLEQHNRQRDC